MFEEHISVRFAESLLLSLNLVLPAGQAAAHPRRGQGSALPPAQRASRVFLLPGPAPQFVPPSGSVPLPRVFCLQWSLTVSCVYRAPLPKLL